MFWPLVEAQTSWFITFLILFWFLLSLFFLFVFRLNERGSQKLTRRVRLVPAVFWRRTASRSADLLHLSAPSHNKRLSHRGRHKHILSSVIGSRQPELKAHLTFVWIPGLHGIEDGCVWSLKHQRKRLNLDEKETESVLPDCVPVEGSVLNSTPLFWEQKKGKIQY